jgi:ankyrin repeat protein
MDSLTDRLVDALSNEDYELAQQLLEEGADVNAPDEDFAYTPLRWAVMGNDTAAARRARWLLKVGAQVARECPRDGYTSVHVAAEEGSIATLRLLLEADGTSALKKFDEVSRTPLICAVHKGHLEAARLLIDAGSDVDANDESSAGDSALRWAINERNIEMVDLLLAAGACPTLPGWMQMTALDHAKAWRDAPDEKLRDAYARLVRASGQ